LENKYAFKWLAVKNTENPKTVKLYFIVYRKSNSTRRFPWRNTLGEVRMKSMYTIPY
jgi:hypothetical protein